MNKKKFQSLVYSYYKKHGRHDLPWRTTTDPYHILVSEIMLQQTQVERVIPKYQAFLKVLPSFEKLAAAPTSKVVTLWQGLGYNRRALSLQKTAVEVVGKYEGKLPDTVEELIELPGIGPYTAGAVLAFAFNKPVACIETNIRTVFTHIFFGTKKKISDVEVLPLIKKMLDEKHPRMWYWALMDYGAMLKRTGHSQNTKSAEYRPQSKFKGSLRQVRGAVVRHLVENKKGISIAVLQKSLDTDRMRLEAAIKTMLRDGLIVQKGMIVSLP